MRDRAPLARLQIIKLTLTGAGVDQRVVDFEAVNAGQRDHWCVRWADDAHEATAPALWYARVLQAPTPRWDHASSGRTIHERAWSSPIFWQPPLAD